MTRPGVASLPLTGTRDGSAGRETGGDGTDGSTGVSATGSTPPEGPGDATAAASPVPPNGDPCRSALASSSSVSYTHLTLPTKA